MNQKSKKELVKMNKYDSIKKARAKILEKVQRKLQFNASDYEFDEELLGDFFDDACSIIQDWKRWSTLDGILTGRYDAPIIQFIIESVNTSGIEGQSSSNANGTSKVFYNTPEANLKSSIPQSI